MAVQVVELINLCCDLYKDEKIKIAAKSSARGATLAGAGAFFGGLMGGPAGILVGAAVGGLLGSLTAEKFIPLPEILRKLTPAQKQHLFTSVIAAMGPILFMKKDVLIRSLIKDKTLYAKLYNALMNFVKHELKIKVK